MTKPSRLKKKVFSLDFWQFEHFKYHERCSCLCILARRGKVIALIAKVIEFQMFSLISGRHVGVPRKDTNMAAVY